MRVHLLTSGVLIMSLELTTDDALSCANAVTAEIQLVYFTLVVTLCRDTQE